MTFGKLLRLFKHVSLKFSHYDHSQNLHLTLSQAVTAVFICLIFITIDIYEKTEPLISQTAVWAACPRGPSQFISCDKGRQARACVATAPGAAGRFDTGGILLPSTGLDLSESGLGS